jgi:hypothetical protein
VHNLDCLVPGTFWLEIARRRRRGFEDHERHGRLAVAWESVGPARVSSPQVDLSLLWPGQYPYSVSSAVHRAPSAPVPQRGRGAHHGYRMWSVLVRSEEELCGQRLAATSFPAQEKEGR